MPRTRAKNAIALLTADHKAVKTLFRQYQKLMSQDAADDDKGAIAELICNELTVHAQVEEEIFYPAARAAIDDDDLLDEAQVEHSTAKDLIAQLKSMEPGDTLYDAKVTVLGEYIDHHVKEEEEEMFPKVRKANLDLVELGSSLAQRKEELKADSGITEARGAIPPPRKNSSRTSAARAWR